jgi:DNA-directed RNA polymerase specialized sigma24 family protein
MNPLTPEQQKTVLEYVRQIKAWIIDRYPIDSYYRDTVEANAFSALVQAIATWQGGSGEDRDKYVWKAIHNSRKRAWRDEEKHQANRDQSVQDGEDLEPLALSREPGPEHQAIINEMPEQDRKVLDWLLDGKSVDEIKTAADKSQATVYRRVSNAKKSLEKLFGK